MSSEFSFLFSNEETRKHNPVAKMNWIEEPETGEVLLKMTLRVIKREHGGWCSEHDFSSEDFTEGENDKIYSTVTIKTIYFKFPEGFDEDWVDEECCVIENEDTEPLFKEWREHSDCEGSGYCNLQDTFIPIKIEYVKIV